MTDEWMNAGIIHMTKKWAIDFFMVDERMNNRMTDVWMNEFIYVVVA